MTPTATGSAAPVTAATKSVSTSRRTRKARLRAEGHVMEKVHLS